VTITSHSLTSFPAAMIGQRWHLRWNASVSAWTDPFDICARTGQRQMAATMVLAWEMLAPDQVMIEAWLEATDHRQDILDRTVLSATACADDALIHLDVLRKADRLLAVTLDPVSERLLYASTSLLTRNGVKVGAFDPPTVERGSSKRKVASA
jgi:hypothetical protein